MQRCRIACATRTHTGAVTSQPDSSPPYLRAFAQCRALEMLLQYDLQPTGRCAGSFLCNSAVDIIQFQAIQFDHHMHTARESTVSTHLRAVYVNQTSSTHTTPTSSTDYYYYYYYINNVLISIAVLTSEALIGFGRLVTIAFVDHAYCILLVLLTIIISLSMQSHKK